MPVEQGNKAGRQALMIGLGAIAAIGVVVYALQQITPDSNASVNLEIATTEVSLGSAADQLSQILENGPSLIPDLQGGDKNFFLTNSGTDWETGWFAINQSQPNCELNLERGADQFTCGDKTFAFDGQGLDQLAVRVDGSQLIVDLGNL